MIPVLDRLAEWATALRLRINEEGHTTFMVVPTGCKVEDLGRFFPPTRIVQSVSLLDAQSFADYVNRFKTQATLVFAAVTDGGATLKAVLDYHVLDGPAECKHVATFATLPTVEWTAWMQANRKAMSQVEFATWLEDHAELFAEPKGADLLELVQTLQGKSDVRFSSAVRLSSGGNKLHYDEDVTLKGQTTTAQGAVDLPTVVTAGIAPFMGAPKYAVRARLKYRIESRKLSLWLETVAPHTVVRESVLEVVRQVAEKTGIVPLLGAV